MNRGCPKCGNMMTLNVITNTWDCTECGFQVDDTENLNVISNEDDNYLNEIDSNIIDENKNKKNNNFTLYHCEKCNISFIGENINNCFMCNSILNKNSINIDYSKYIDFKLNLRDAIHNYKRKLSLKLLCPFIFRNKKTISKIKGVFIPFYLFDTRLDGDVVFYASDVDVLDLSKTDKKIQYFKVVCKGHFDYNDVLINGSNKIKNSILEKIDNYDYNDLKEIDSLKLDEKIILKEDYDEYQIFDRLKNRCNNSSVKLMSDLVNHVKKKVVDNKLDFQYEKKGIILVPAYILNVKYKNKEYTYIMNGQNGNTYIKTPIGIVETIVFSIVLFTLLFAIMLLIAVII